jgi:hypothetical protein
MRYEEALSNREREARRRAVAVAESREVTREVTTGEKTELLEAADALETLGFSPVVFLRRAVDAQERIAKDTDFASAREAREGNEKTIEAIARLLQEPDGGPDVLYSPGLLGVLQQLRYGAVPRFAGGPPLPFTPAEFDWVSWSNRYARGNEGAPRKNHRRNISAPIDKGEEGRQNERARLTLAHLPGGERGAGECPEGRGRRTGRGRDRARTGGP